MTVLGASKEIKLLRTNGDGLTGQGSSVSNTRLERDVGMLQGSFARINPLTEMRSREIPYDASADLLETAIENDLEIRVHCARVLDTHANIPGLGRRWIVTFIDYEGPFGTDVNVPNFLVSDEHLEGYGNVAWSHVASEGRGPLSGQFALSIRDSRFTDFIPYNASAEALKSALEDFESVNTATVSPRETLPGDTHVYGFRWRITFDSVNKLTEYGWSPDPDGESSSGNLPPLVFESRLVGWNAGFKVDHVFGAGESDTQAHWMDQKQGDSGFRSGKVYVFAKLSPLVAGDVAFDSVRFGWSVSTSPVDDKNSYVALVGSPGWNDNAGKAYTLYGRDNNWIAAEFLTGKAWGGASPEDEFAHAVEVASNFSLVSTPGYHNEQGTVFVFTRTRSNFLASQRLTAPGGSHVKGRFGHAIGLRRDASEAVMCAPDASGGVCYVYSRDGTGTFHLSQALVPSNVMPGDRFGWNCAITHDIILIGQLEAFGRSNGPERPVQIVKTFSDSVDCPEALGGHFHLAWKAQNATAGIVRRALEQDLNCGSVNVTRAEAPDRCGGYTWSGTFNDSESYRLQGSGIPILSCSTGTLSGTAPRCSVRVTSDVVKKLRSKAHVFRKQPNGSWEEQAFLLPHRPQRQDLFGYSVALDGRVGLVGAPNRDMLNVNGGAALVFDLRFVDVSFGARSYKGLEGESIEVKVHRKNSLRLDQQILGLATIDRNADNDMQNYENNLYSFRSQEIFPGGKTSTDLLSFSTALGRSKGNNLWIHGMYDYRAISDYSPIERLYTFDQNQTDLSVFVETTNDQTLEKPDENITLQLHIPGMFASRLGGLVTTITLQDISDDLACYDKLYGADTTEADRFGSAVDILESSGLMLIGSEWASGLDSYNNSVEKAGTAYIFMKDSTGKWTQTATLSPDSSSIVAGGRFGSSVSIDKPYGREDVTALVGAPGQGKAFVFSHNARNDIWELQSVLEPD